MKSSCGQKKTDLVSAEEYNALLDELEATRKQLHFAKALVDNIPFPVFSKDEEGALQSVNKAYEEFFQVSRENVLNKDLNSLEYFSSKEQENYHKEALYAIQNLTGTHCERVYSVPKGDVSTLFWSKGFVVPQGDDRGLVGIIVDISKQKNLEKDLAQKVEELREVQQHMEASRERMELMLDTMPLAAQIWTEDGQMLDTSLEAVRLFEFTDKKTYWDNFNYIHPEYQPNGKKSLEVVKDFLAESFAHGSAHIEWLHIDRAGQEVPIDITSIRSSLHGQSVVVVFLRDLREHYANLEKLREADAYTNLMFDFNPLGTLVWDHNFTLIHCNKALAVGFGFDSTEELIANFDSLIPEFQPDGTPSVQMMQEGLQQTATEGSVKLSWVGLSRYGEEIPCYVRGIRVKYGGEFVVMAYVEDLRQSEAQKKKLRMAEQRTAAILSGVPLSINLLRPDFTIIDCNEVAIDLIGTKDKEEYLAEFHHVLAPIQPDGRTAPEHIQDILHRTRTTGRDHCEILAINMQGEEVPLEITAVSAHLEHEELYIVYAHDLRETRRMLKEIELARKAAEQSAQAKSEFLAAPP